MKKKAVAMLTAAAMLAAMLTGCGNSQAPAQETTPAETAAAEETAAPETVAEETAAPEETAAEETTAVEETAAAAETAEEAPAETVVLKTVCDLTPHSEILNAAKDLLAAEGIEIDIVSTTWDASWNEMLVDGEVDFAYFMHVPAMESIEEEMGVTLYSAGTVHIEPYACFSNKVNSVDDLPENAVIAVPNDASNEYRALKVLEENGFIKLSDEMTSLNASAQMVTEYVKPIEIVEMDQANIIPMGDDFDAYFVNVNRALEAGLDTTAYLMREGEDSEYANIITVTEENKDNPAIAKMVEVLKSDEIKKFIEDHYNGAVIPAK